MDLVVVIKFVSALLYPIGFFGACVFAALLLRLLGWSKFSGVTLGLGLMAVLVFSIPKTAETMAWHLESRYPIIAVEDYDQHDFAVVLGGGLRIPTLPAVRSQIGHASDRLLLASELYKQGKVRGILLTGGNVYPQKGLDGEAVYAKRLLVSWGVADQDILVEQRSRTTFENSVYSLQRLKELDVNTALLITSAIHMPRAMPLFQGSQIQVRAAVADQIVRFADRPRWQTWMPSASAMQLSTLALHEIYGMWFYSLKEKIEKRQ